MRLNPFSGKEPKELSEDQRNRRLIIELALKSIFLAMLTIAVLYAIVSAILGSSIFIPNSAAGVLDSVKVPASYTWSSESIRRVQLGGSEQEQHQARSATVDTDLNRFQAMALNVLDSNTLYSSDGKLTISIDEDAQMSGEDAWRMVTDYCNGAEAVPASALEMPSPEMLKAADPEIVNDKATAFGRRSWELSFKPTPQIVERLLWIDFFKQVAAGEMDWVISEDELAKVQAGDFEAEYANAWVTRDDRRLMQIDMKLEITGGSRYRLMAQVVPSHSEEEHPLAATNLDPDDSVCRSGASSG